MTEAVVKTVPIKDGDLNVSDDNNPAVVQDGVVTQGGMMQINVAPGDVVDENGKAAAKKAEDGLDPHKLIAGKYKTQEEFDKAIVSAFHKKHGDKATDAYNELSGDLSSDNDSDTSVNDNDGSDSDNSDNDGQDADNDADNNDADNNDADDNDQSDITPHMNKFVQEFAKDGKLADESYETLEGAGYDRAMVNTFLKGVMVTQGELYDKVGGKENYATMQDWAGKNLSEAEIQLFNDDMNSEDEAKMHRAVDMVAGKFVKANGGFAPKKRVSPEGGEINTTVSGYTHIDQLKADQANPLYQTSAKFREQVKMKLKHGSI